MSRPAPPPADGDQADAFPSTDVQAAELSVVIPALNEQDNVEPLVTQVQQSMVDAEIRCELIIVDDGSTDQTLERLLELAKDRPWLKVLHRDSPQGQSAAMHAGIAHASGAYIATLDADLQNDPAELPVMLSLLKQHDVDMVQGDRSANRKDNVVRRVGSIVGRLYRRLMLGDPVRDTGCSARVMRAAYAKQIPLQFKGMHRFFPAYVRLMGGRIHEMPVVHRSRHAGTTKYGLGLLNRGFSGFFDGLSVRWMSKRWRNVSVTCMTNDTSRHRSATHGADALSTGDGTMADSTIRDGSKAGASTNAASGTDQVRVVKHVDGGHPSMNAQGGQAGGRLG